MSTKLSTRDLNERVTLITLEIEPDQYGGYQEKWYPLRECWAKVEPIMPKEAPANESIHLNDKSLHRPSNRYHVTINSALEVALPLRIKWQKITMAVIASPILTQNRAFWSITCQALRE